MCGITEDSGAAVVFTYTAYTLSTSDGVHLTGDIASTSSVGGSTCTEPITITAAQ
jgi:hypothetical protein